MTEAEMAEISAKVTLKASDFLMVPLPRDDAPHPAGDKYVGLFYRLPNRAHCVVVSMSGLDDLSSDELNKLIDDRVRNAAMTLTDSAAQEPVS